MQQVEEKCIKCKKDVEDEENIFRCDSCKRPIHENCSELSSSELRCMPLRKRRLRLLCDNCKQFMENLPTFLNAFQDIKTELSELKKICLEVSRKSSTEEKDCSDADKELEKQSKITYSQKVKSRQEVLIVKPREKKVHSEVKKDLGNKVDPLELNVEVKIGKSIRDGGYILECKKGDVEQVREKIEKDMGKEYIVSKPRISNPMIKIVNVPVNIPRDKDMLMDRIIKQNRVDNKKEGFKFDIFHMSAEHNNRGFNILAEVDVDTFNLLMSNEEIYMGLYACKVFEFVRLKKCYKCCGYNHTSRECTEKVACPRCSEEHQQKDCKSKEVKCVNCIRANRKYNLELDSNHTTWDRACKWLVKTEELRKGKLHYSQ